MGMSDMGRTPPPGAALPETFSFRLRLRLHLHATQPRAEVPPC